MLSDHMNKMKICSLKTQNDNGLSPSQFDCLNLNSPRKVGCNYFWESPVASQDQANSRGHDWYCVLADCHSLEHTWDWHCIKWCTWSNVTLTLNLSDVHKPIPTPDLLCSSSSVSDALGHCPLSLTLPEGEPLRLMVKVTFAGFPLLTPKMQPPDDPSATVCTQATQAAFGADWGEKRAFCGNLLPKYSSPGPDKVSHGSVPSTTTLHSFFISWKQLSTLFPTYKIFLCHRNK